MEEDDDDDDDEEDNGSQSSDWQIPMPSEEEDVSSGKNEQGYLPRGGGR